MSELPSIYSGKGLSTADRKRTITVGARTTERPTGATHIKGRVSDVLDQQENATFASKKYDNEDSDGDIPMLGMDDEAEIQLIADYVHERRQDNIKFPEYTRDYQNEGSETNLTPEQPLSRESILVLDTNFIISHLNIVDQLSKLHSKYHHKIVVPNTVVQELDGLKGSKRTADNSIDGTTVGHLARWANDWIYKKLADIHSSVRGQKLREVLDRNAIKDDAILDCCLYFQQHENSLVILLSNDKNLCMKALTNDILTVSYRKDMSAEIIARKVFQENQSQSPSHNKPLLEIKSPKKVAAQPVQEVPINLDLNRPVIQPQQQRVPRSPKKPIRSDSLLIQLDNLIDAAQLIYSEVQKIVLGSVDYCMYQEYEEDVDMVGYDKAQVLTLHDAAQVMIRFWVSVFVEYFQNSIKKPFNGRGKKQPRFVRVPYTEAELHDFITYWSDVLRALYLKRDDPQNDALEKIIERWEYIAKPF